MGECSGPRRKKGKEMVTTMVKTMTTTMKMPQAAVLVLRPTLAPARPTLRLGRGQLFPACGLTRSLDGSSFAAAARPPTTAVRYPGSCEDGWARLHACVYLF